METRTRKAASKHTEGSRTTTEDLRTPSRDTSEEDERTQTDRQQYLARLREEAARLDQEEEIRELEERIRAGQGERKPRTPTAPVSHALIKPKDLPTYLGKSLTEARDWRAEAENAFSLSPASFQSDELKVRWASQFLCHTIRSQWNGKTLEADWIGYSWQDFIDFLQDALEHPANRMANAYIRWNTAKQRDNQSVADFNNYLQALEQQIEEQPAAMAAMTFFAKLKEDLQQQILKSGQDLPTTRGAMVTLASRMEGNPKRRQSSPKQLPIIKKPRPGFTRREGGSGPAAQRTYNSAAAHPVTCFNCGKIGHIATSCLSRKKTGDSPPRGPRADGQGKGQAPLR